MPPILLWPIAFVLLGAYALTDFRRQKGLLQKRMDRAKALGCPITAEEYAACMGVPGEQNAASIYARLPGLIESLEAEYPSSAKLLRELDLKCESVNKELETAVEDARPLILLLEEASAYSSHRLSRLDDPSNETLEDKTAASMRFAGRALIADILIRATTGDLEEAKKKMAVLRIVVEHSFYEPSVLSWLVRIAHATGYLRTLNQLARIAHNEPGFLDWIERQLDNAPELTPLLPCVKAEAAFSLAYGEMLKRTDFKKIADPVPFPFSKRYFRTEAAIDAYISRGFERLLNTLKAWPEDESDWMKVGAAYQTHKGAPWWVTPSAVWHGGSANAAASIPGYLTNLKVSRAGLWLYRQKAALGCIPPDLSALGAEARDAMNNAPFVLQTDGETFEIRAGSIRY